MKYQGVLFRTFNGNSYIYDNMTATSFRIPDCVDTPKQFLKFIDKKRSFENHKLKKIMVHNNNAFYRRMQKQYGAFTESILPHPSKTTVDEVKKFIDNECFFQLILVVTDDCNLRCKYCFFSDAYPHTRNRSSNQMSLMTAKKAIDYFFTKIERIHQRYPGRKACITFYGGEPLLNFDLIQSVIEYVKTRYSNNILYSLSTNGTLLSSDKLKFLVDNNVNIFISLDGPQEEHDRLRVYPNNKGSFAEVYNHCVNIKEKYPKYRRVMLLCTYDWKTDLIQTNRFFEENEDKLPLIGFVTSVTSSFTDYYNQFTSADKEQFNRQLASLAEDYKGAKISGKYASNYLEILFGGYVATALLHGKMGNRRPSVLPITGACIPGNKICVQPDGQIDICERVNGRFPIGHVNTGLDYEEITNILSLYKDALFEKCLSCSVSKLCTMCFQHFGGGNNFLRNPANVCDLYEKNMIDRLAFAYSILEKNPDAFNDLNFGLIKCGL